MTSEFNLSDKIYISDSDEVVHVVDVKEAVRRLKEEHKNWRQDLGKGKIVDKFELRIDKIAGEKLI